MNNGFNISEVLCIIESKENIIIVNEIKQDLNNGVNIEESFREFIQEDIKKYFDSFIIFIPFSMALKLSLDLYTKNLENKNKIINKVKYPIVMLILSFIGIILFYQLVFNKLMEFALTFDVDFTHIFLTKNLILSFVLVIITVLIIILLIYVYLRFNHDKYLLCYIMICKYFKGNFFVKINTYSFVSFYIVCYKNGIKTLDTINLLKSLKSKIIVSFIANHLEIILVKGNSFKDALVNDYVDSKLIKFINIAMYTDTFDKMLEQYLHDSDELFERNSKLVTNFISFVSYSLIAILIVSVYQIILLPLSILGNF